MNTSNAYIAVLCVRAGIFGKMASLRLSSHKLNEVHLKSMPLRRIKELKSKQNWQ